MADIKILVDTGADLPPEIAEKYNIGIIPLITLFGEKSYVQGIDLTNEEFYEKLESFDGFPTTSHTPYMDMYNILEKAALEHESVIYFTISQSASGQFQTASMTAQEIMDKNPNADIRIVNTSKFSVFIAHTAVSMAEMAMNGKNADEIMKAYEDELYTWKCFLLVDNLKYLEKGGRLSKTSAFVGSLLDVKPILGIEEGLVVVSDKIRGKKKLVDKLISKVEEDSDFCACGRKEFLVVQSDDEKGREICEKLRGTYGDDCVKMYSQFGPLIATHTGKGSYAILCRIDKKLL